MDLQVERSEIEKVRSRFRNRAGILTFEAYVATGRTLLREEVKSQSRYDTWHREYRNWLAVVQEHIRQFNGHQTAGKFGRHPGLIVAGISAGGFNVDHGGELAMLQCKIQFLVEMLEEMKDRA